MDRQNRYIEAYKSAEAGLSLLEMAILLTIVGLIMGSIIGAYNTQVAQARISTTDTNYLTIQKALQKFFTANNRLPCPADITLNTTSTAYGQESGAAGTCAGAGVVADPTHKVVKGGVPFAALNIPESATMDGWYDKITYVVTLAHTVAPLNPTNNAISVRYFPSALDIPTNTYTTDSAPFLLISYGQDGLGGYTMSGVSRGLCPTAASPVPFEAVNCNNGTLFWRWDNITSTVPGINYDDDQIDSLSYLPSMDGLIWAFSPPNAAAAPPVPAYTNIFSIDYVGIGVSSPQYPLDVNGSVLAAAQGTTPSQIYSQTYCDYGGANCFPATVIGGTIGTGGMGVGTTTSAAVCPAGGAMSGIASRNAICNPGVVTATTQTCPFVSTPLPAHQTYVTGFGAGGTVICSP